MELENRNIRSDFEDYDGPIQPYKTVKIQDLYLNRVDVKGIIAQVTDPNDFHGSERWIKGSGAGIYPKYRELVGFEELPNGYGHSTIYLRYKTLEENYNGLISLGSDSFPHYIQIPLI